MNNEGELEKFYPNNLREELKVEKLGGGLSLKTLKGHILKNISNEDMNRIARCYMEVFNESWKENWSIQTAKEELNTFINEQERYSIASFLEKNKKVIGLACGQITNTSNLKDERDMPFSLTKNKKTTGLEKLKEWMEGKNEKELLIFREIATLKKHRGKIDDFLSAPYLARPILREAKKQHIPLINYWTNTNSPAFLLGIGLQWEPIYSFDEQNLVLMGGDVQYSYELINRMIEEGGRKSPAFKEGLYNIDKYLADSKN